MACLMRSVKNEDFIRDLNAILRNEQGSVMQCILYTYKLQKMGRREEASELLSIGNDEIRHVEKLSKVIADMGGKPTTDAKWSRGADGTGQMMEVNMVTSKRSISIYERLVTATEKEGLADLNRLLKEQLEDEVRHIRTLERLLETK